MTTIYFQRSFQRGFGTYPLHGDVLRTAMRTAAETGYRAFDTAQMYGNEAEVGAVLAELGIPADELCITTKVHPDNYRPRDSSPPLRPACGTFGAMSSMCCCCTGRRSGARSPNRSSFCPRPSARGSPATSA